MVLNIKKIIIFWLIPVFLLGFWNLRQPILSFLAGFFVGLAIQTLAFFLNYKLKTNYYLNVALIYLLLILLVSVIFYFVIKVLIEEIPNLLPRLYIFLNQFNIDIKSYLEKLEIKNFTFKDGTFLFNGDFSKVFDFISNLFGGFFSLIVSFILVFVVSIYTAFQKNFPQQVFKIFSDEKRELYEKQWRRIKRKISFWFLGQVITMLFIGLFTYLFTGPILGINYALLIGLLAGVLEIIPILGPLITLFVASILTFIDQPNLILFVIIFFILLQQIESHILVPLVMKRAVSLNPLMVILGILIGGKFGGIIGIVVILPLLGVVTELINIAVAGSSNGRTSPSGGEDPGSSPGPAE